MHIIGRFVVRPIIIGVKMKFSKVIVFLFTFVVFSGACLATGASKGKVYRIYYNHDGYTYVLLASGNNSTECFHGSSYGSHRMSSTASDYERKLSLIMMAFAANKTLHLQDMSPNGTITYCDIDIITVTD